MDRLTYDGNFCDIAQCLEMRGGKHCPDGYCSQRRVWERLKEYEETGLEPNEIKVALDGATREFMAYDELGPIDHLRELVQAEKDGRLVTLPDGKIGDFVKWNNGVSFLYKEISNIIICPDGLRYDLGDFEPFVTDTRISKILTHEEAKEFLNKGESKNEETNVER